MNIEKGHPRRSERKPLGYLGADYSLRNATLDRKETSTCIDGYTLPFYFWYCQLNQNGRDNDEKILESGASSLFSRL